MFWSRDGELGGKQEWLVLFFYSAFNSNRAPGCVSMTVQIDVRSGWRYNRGVPRRPPHSVTPTPGARAGVRGIGAGIEAIGHLQLCCRMWPV